MKAAATMKSVSDDDDEEKHNFKMECEATDALVRIGGMLLDVVQILLDCHEMKRRQIYGQSAALVRPSPKLSLIHI